MPASKITPEPKGAKSSPGKVEAETRDKGSKETAPKDRRERNDGAKNKESSAAKEKADRDRQVREKEKRARATAGIRGDSRAAPKPSSERKTGKVDTTKRATESKEAAKSTGAEKTSAKTPEKRANTSAANGAPRGKDTKTKNLDKIQKSLVELAAAGSQMGEGASEKGARRDVEKSVKQLAQSGFSCELTSNVSTDQNKNQERIVNVKCTDRANGDVHSVNYKSDARGESLRGSTTSLDGKTKEWLRKDAPAHRESYYNPEYKSYKLGNQSKQPPQRREEKAPKTLPPTANPPPRVGDNRPERVGSPNQQPDIDEVTVERLKQYEGNGLRGRPFQRYKDSAGVPTVGYGSTRGFDGGPVPERVSAEEAEELLRRDIRQFKKQIARIIRVPLTGSQHRSVLTFAYNLGIGKLAKLAADINEGDFDRAATRMETFNKAKDAKTGKLVILKGLTDRRNIEARDLRNSNGPTYLLTIP